VWGGKVGEKMIRKLLDARKLEKIQHKTTWKQSISGKVTRTFVLDAKFMSGDRWEVGARMEDEVSTNSSILGDKSKVPTSITPRSDQEKHFGMFRRMV
jgi:hypothetical protein